MRQKQIKSRFIRFEISTFLILRKCFFNDTITVRQFDRWPFQRASTWQLDHRIIGWAVKVKETTGCSPASHPRSPDITPLEFFSC